MIFNIFNQIFIQQIVIIKELIENEFINLENIFLNAKIKIPKAINRETDFSDIKNFKDPVEKINVGLKEEAILLKQ